MTSGPQSMAHPGDRCGVNHADRVCPVAGYVCGIRGTIRRTNGIRLQTMTWNLIGGIWAAFHILSIGTLSSRATRNEPAMLRCQNELLQTAESSLAAGRSVRPEGQSQTGIYRILLCINVPSPPICATRRRLTPPPSSQRILRCSYVGPAELRVDLQPCSSVA